MPCQHVEINAVMKDGHVGAKGDGTNKTIDQLANGLSLSATEPIKRSRIVVVRRLCRNHGSPRQQPAKVVQVSFVARASKHLHPNRIAGRNLAFKQDLDAITGCRPGVPKKLNPRGRIDQNHIRRLDRNSSRLPSQPDPRSRRASLTSRGSAARVRSAKLTASRFVVRR